MSKDNPRRILPRFNSETDFNPSAIIYIDWREELEGFLIAAGTNGRTQSLCVKRVNRWANAAEVTAHLEALREEGKVQKFKDIPGERGGPTATIWRATALILT